MQPCDPADLACLAARRTAAPGIRLVVGHSNAADRLAGLPGADPGPAVDEAAAQDRLCAISVDAGGTVRSRLDRYGAPSRIEAETP